jgi:hypothetical protein
MASLFTQYYVDPSLNANSGTGTSGDPFGDLQYALNTVTRDSTNGDQFNIKAGTSEFPTATLSFATYGTPTGTAPVIFRGYTSAANDGGIGVIDGNAGNFVLIGSINSVGLIDMRLTNSGTNRLMTLGSGAMILRCILGGSNYYEKFSTTSSAIVAGCKILSDASPDGAQFTVQTASSVIGNYVLTNGTGIVTTAGGCFVAFNVVKQTAGGNGIDCLYPNSLVAYNTIIGGGSTANARGIKLGLISGRGVSSAIGNVIANYAGTGAYGIYNDLDYMPIIAHNAFYNCASNTNFVEDPILSFGNLTLSADPFVDAANGDYRLKTDSTAIEAGWPGSYPGLDSVTSLPDIGAYQRGAGTATIYRRIARILGG